LSLDAFGVTDPKSDDLLGFLQKMEFNTLTRRVAEKLGAEPPPMLEKSVGSTVAKSAKSDGAAAESGEAGSPSTAVAAGSALAKSKPFDVKSYETVRSEAALVKWLDAARAAGRFAFDTETTSLDAMQADLVGFSIATEPGKACYVPLAHTEGSSDLFGGGKAPDQMDRRAALALLKPLLEDPSVLKIGQNLKYDALVLAQHDIRITPLDDTMLLSYALDGGRGGHGMDDLSIRHMGHTCIPFSKVIESAPGAKKSERTFAGVPIDKATEYAAEDADVTLRLWLALKPRLAAEHMATVYETLERPLLPVIVDMERAGIKVDPAILSRLSAQFAQSIARLDEEVQALAGEKFNLGSPKQLGELLFDRLKLPGGKRTKSGQWETRAGLLDDLANNEELPDDARKLVNTMMEWRQLSKLRSTYTDALPVFINPTTKRIHTSYALAATTTGRLASSDPNLQNIPVRTKEGRAIRTAFIADAGHKLVSADYSQIELRVLAHIADIPQLKKAFADGLD
ncbi:MAG: DNA polymerase, partial [Hyphomicrobiaceae bacterium]